MSPRFVVCGHWCGRGPWVMKMLRIALASVQVVVDIDGDGSFLMNCQELATAAIEKMNIKMCILNNQHLGMVVQWEDRFYKANRAHTYLGKPVRCLSLLRTPPSLSSRPLLPPPPLVIWRGREGSVWAWLFHTPPLGGGRGRLIWRDDSSLHTQTCAAHQELCQSKYGEEGGRSWL